MKAVFLVVTDLGPSQCAARAQCGRRRRALQASLNARAALEDLDLS
jgi:hypothetical protein